MRKSTEETKARAKETYANWVKDNALKRAITNERYWHNRVLMLQKQEELDKSSSETMNN